MPVCQITVEHAVSIVEIIGDAINKVANQFAVVDEVALHVQREAKLQVAIGTGSFIVFAPLPDKDGVRIVFVQIDAIVIKNWRTKVFDVQFARRLPVNPLDVQFPVFVIGCQEAETRFVVNQMDIFFRVQKGVDIQTLILPLFCFLVVRKSVCRVVPQ